MGESDDFAFSREDGLGEEQVPQIPSGHFEGEAVRTGVGADIRAIGVKRQAEALGGDGDKSLVLVAFVAAKLVVEVGDLEAPIMLAGEVVEQVEQNHGIDPSGYRHENPVSVLEQGLLRDISRHPACPRCHDGSLALGRRNETKEYGEETSASGWGIGGVDPLAAVGLKPPAVNAVRLRLV